MSDGLNVGTVKGTVELEDRMSSALDLLEHKIESVDQAFGGFGAHVAEQAASFFTAEVAFHAVEEAAHLAAETLKEITLEGSHAADIEDTFEHLTEGANIAGDALTGRLASALRGTVTDMDIMKRVNQNLAAGLDLSADQMEVLAKGAFALAKATGGDTAGAMDKLSDAMVTGRTRGIALLTGKIDLTSAEERYAESLGTTAKRLTEQEKMEAIQQEILRKVGENTDRVGDQQVRLADKLQQVQVEFANFEEELGTAIATSPVVAAGFDNIRTAIEDAFGQEQALSVKSLAHDVDAFAIRLIDAAEAGVNAGAILAQEWEASKVVFGDIAQIVDGDILVFKYLTEGVYELGKALHLDGAAANVDRLDNEIQKLMETMAERGRALQKDKAAEDEWAVSSGKVVDALEGIKKKMIEAQANEGDFNNVIRDNVKVHNDAAGAADKHGKAEQAAGIFARMTKEELEKYGKTWENLSSVGENYRVTLESLKPDQIETIKYYLEAGVAVEELATAFPNLTKAQIEAVKSAEAFAKVEAEAGKKLNDMWAASFEKQTELYGSDTKKAIAAADEKYRKAVEIAQEEGNTDVEYYNQLWALRNRDVALAEGARLQDDANSKAHLAKKIQDEKDYYDFQQRHRDDFTQADLDSTAKEIKALEHMRDTWGAVGNSIDKDTEKVRTLAGEVLTLKEYEARQLAGNSITYDLSTDEGLAYFKQMNPAAQINWTDDKIEAFFKKGGTLEQLIKMGIINLYANMGGAGNWNGPTFANGGAGDFGSGTLAMLHGKEIITPIDKVGGSMMGDTQVVNHFYVNGTAEDVANKIYTRLMTQLKSVRKWPAAT